MNKRDDITRQFINFLYSLNKSLEISSFFESAPPKTKKKIGSINIEPYLEYIKKNVKKSDHSLDEIKELIHKGIVVWELKNKDLNVFFNESVVLFVSAFEVFMKDLFISSINQYGPIKKKIRELDYGINITIKELYSNKEIAEKIASNFKFQRMKSIRKAFREILGVNINGLVPKKTKIDGKEYEVFKEIEKLILMRNKIVHEGERFRLKYKEIDTFHGILIFFGINFFFNFFLTMNAKSRGKFN